ncbi:hypothetical protein [Ulvibacter litoralis]|uniref:Trimeric autotransporter adhesin YadA-like head domain-containing protein n=1 Tax=Ulvibacter litoralis TaxID=227084 RepID=A0A1G7HZG0_9FLAO|nr:hypothetical protein [Ulvibacter litoralis]GHC63054.1 hypothetical protein GCM10008083_30470 [Ulvibacter litoralis]SDF05534.1 hypothetical protein SAMN05421855_1054 [Ulvibacter litoralis]
MRTFLLTISVLFLSVAIYAQNGINYKALIKDVNGDVLSNQAITIQFQILEGGTTNVYQETQNTMTDSNGIIMVNIGEGTVDSGDFSILDWGVDHHFLNVQIDTGAGMVDLGATEFMSVPYANFAEDTRKGTLNDAYNKGGAGLGKTIIATGGAVTINGEDGFLVTGANNVGDTIAITGSGSRMFFNPRKAAFRAGNANNTSWDHVNIGESSAGFGYGTIASGTSSSAFGVLTTASGNFSSAFGVFTTASGLQSAAFGSYTRAIGESSAAFGNFTEASGNNSVAFGEYTESSGFISTTFGYRNDSPSYAETTFGVYATEYTPTDALNYNIADRLFSIGNGTGLFERKNALTIYKSGLMNINDAYNMPLIDGSAGQVMTTDGNGNVSFENVVDTGTDDQNLTIPTLAGTMLTLGIENGNGTSVDLKPLTEILKNPQYPDGFEGMTPITIGSLDGAGYTVPVGKTFYLTNYYTSTTSTFFINNLQFLDTSQNFNNVNSFENPLLINAGVTITNSSINSSVSGFLIDSGVAVVINTNNYTVPIGKIFVLLSVSSFNNQKIEIDGKVVYSGKGININSPGLTSFSNPIFVDEGKAVTYSGFMNGYLIDKN